jgi:hypothetical protein
MKKRTLVALVLAGLAGLALTVPSAPAQKASDPAFKVKIDFNRWHDTNELAADMKRLQAAFPKFLKLESIGKSFRGRDLWLMTINNPATGPESEPAPQTRSARRGGRRWRPTGRAAPSCPTSRPRPGGRRRR